MAQVVESKVPFTSEPDEHGRFGQFGGKFAPETVMGALDELEVAETAVLANGMAAAVRHDAVTDVGAVGAIIGPPTLVNAIADALAPLGVECLTLPLSPSRLFDLMEGAEG